MKLFSKHLLFVLAIILTSCGTPPTAQFPSGSIQPSQIKEPQIGAPYTEIAIQEIRTSNCDGANPTTTVSRSLVQEQTTFFEVAVEAGGLVRGTPIPTVLEAELEAKIKAALGSNLGNKFEQSISTVLETQAGQAWQHKIFWNETKVKGVIDVVYQNGTATLNFEKVIAIELYDRTSESLACDGTGAITLPAPTLETQPPPAKTMQPTQASSTGKICYGQCWQYDNNARTMTWMGLTDGTEDIWQPSGEPLQNIRDGFTAIITTTVPGEIFACILTVDGKVVKNSCDGVLYQISAGTYRITSAGSGAGGFRWCPAIGYGWRVNGGECK